MADGIFIGLTEAELLALRTAAVELLKGGGTVTSSISAGGKTRQLQVAMAPKDILLEVRFALRKLDPATYGGRIVRKTYARKRGDCGD